MFSKKTTLKRKKLKERGPSKKRRAHQKNLKRSGELVQKINGKASQLDERIRDSEDESNSVDIIQCTEKLNSELESILSRRPLTGTQHYFECTSDEQRNTLLNNRKQTIARGERPRETVLSTRQLASELEQECSKLREQNNKESSFALIKEMEP